MVPLPYNKDMPLRVINVLYLGRVDYSIALELQQTLVRLVKEGRITPHVAPAGTPACDHAGAQCRSAEHCCFA